MKTLTAKMSNTPNRTRIFKSFKIKKRFKLVLVALETQYLVTHKLCNTTREFWEKDGSLRFTRGLVIANKTKIQKERTGNKHS